MWNWWPRTHLSKRNWKRKRRLLIAMATRDLKIYLHKDLMSAQKRTTMFHKWNNSTRVRTLERIQRKKLKQHSTSYCRILTHRVKLLICLMLWAISIQTSLSTWETASKSRIKNLRPGEICWDKERCSRCSKIRSNRELKSDLLSYKWRPMKRIGSIRNMSRSCLRSRIS